MKPINVALNIYIYYSVDDNDKKPKYKVGDHVRISMYNAFLLRDRLQIGWKKYLLLSRLKMGF